MLKIEVVKQYVKHVTGSKGENAGKKFDIAMMEAYAHLPGEKYPIRCDFALAKDQAPFAPGPYLLGPGSFYVDNYGALALRRNLDLVPEPKKA